MKALFRAVRENEAPRGPERKRPWGDGGRPSGDGAEERQDAVRRRAQSRGRADEEDQLRPPRGLVLPHGF